MYFYKLIIRRLYPLSNRVACSFKSLFGGIKKFAIIKPKETAKNIISNIFNHRTNKFFLIFLEKYKIINMVNVINIANANNPIAGNELKNDSSSLFVKFMTYDFPPLNHMRTYAHIINDICSLTKEYYFGIIGNISKST